MTEMTGYQPGSFCWADLASTDAAAAKAFYAELFGWTPSDQPAGEGVYTLFSRDGRATCGLFQMNHEMLEQGIPPHWQSYVSVASADDTSNRAETLGGTVIMPPFDVMDAGRMAVFRDPTGAAFALWEPRQHIGAQLLNEPGALCWHELQTNDPEAAERFYTQLFGWNSQTSSAKLEFEYTEFKSGNGSGAGMIQIQEEWGEVPPNWAVYFGVADFDASLEKTKQLGGQPLMDPMDIEGVGRFAFVQDPQGASFAIIQLAHEVS